MTNNPILPIPVSKAIADDDNISDESLLAANNPNLDEGESTDDQATVDEDLREADEVNEKLEE